MDIVNTYLELGSYRGAADLCGVDHKTVKRVVQRWRVGTIAEPRTTPARARNTDCVESLIGDKVAKTRGRITAKRLLPQARAAGYEGSARNFRRAVARAKARWARSEHHRRPWVPTPGEHLVIDWGEEGPLKIFCAVLAWSRYRFVRFATNMKRETTLRLLAKCIEELGYLPMDAESAHWIFEVVTRRYERGSIVLTSNRGFAEWGQVFADTVVASAILDRLLHYSTVMNIKGKSFRMRAHEDQEVVAML